MNQRRLIWIAIVFSTLLYGVLAYATERDYTLQPLSLAMRRPVVIALYAIAIAIYAAALLTSSAMDARSSGPDGRRVSTPASFIVRLALLETVAIIGLASAIVIRDWRLYLPAWILALVGLFNSYPPASDEQ